MAVQRPSRKKLVEGDVFAPHFPTRGYVFGRVIGVDLTRERAPMPGANLVYVYDGAHPDCEPDIESLSPTRLLVPPMFINRLPWSRGYFVTVASRPLQADDLLPAHYFWSAARGRYVDEAGSVLDFQPPAPVGEWGLHSFRTFDDAVSEALGVPPVPE